jgi:polysaccharide export outer membrane protein
MMRLLIFFFIVLGWASCTNSKDVYYMHGLGNEKVEGAVKEVDNPTIQKGDQLSIFVNSLNIEQATYFNMSNYSAIQISSAQQMQTANPILGYMVEEDGKITFPKLGSIAVAGMKRKELQAYLEVALSDYIKDPVVSVRCINFRITVLGEVSKPGTYHVPYHNLNLLQALGLAGDLTINGVRNELILVRKTDKGEQSAIIDLTSKDLLKSPYFYVQSGDVIYVKPNRTKINTSSTFFQVWPTVVSAITLLVLVVTNIK